MKTYTRNFFLMLVVGMLFQSAHAKAQFWEWGKQSLNSSVEAWPIATDQRGNVYASGYSENALPTYFGVLGISYNVPSGGAQCVLAKYDSSGNLLWAQGFQNSASQPYNMTTDKDGNLLYLGIFNGATLQIGSATLTNPIAPAYQYFLVKFSPSGAVLWAKNDGSGTFLTILETDPLNTVYFSPGGLTTDQSDNVYITAAYTVPTVTVGAYTLVNTDPSGYSDDIIVAKYDSMGNLQWAKSYGGSSYDEAYGISVMPNGNIYLAGAFFSPSVTFGDSTITNPYADSSVKRAFIARLDPMGNAQWAEAAGGSKGAYAVATVSDTDGSLYVTGAFGDSTVTFDTTTFSSPYPGTASVYLLKLDSAGNVIWHKTIATPSSYVMSYSIALGNCSLQGTVDSGGSSKQVWIGGLLRDSADVDGTLLRLPAGSIDPLFLVGYDRATGSVQGIQALPQGGADQFGIACDRFGNVLVCSDFSISTIYIFNHDTLEGNNVNSGGYFFAAKYLTDLCKDTVAVNNHLGTPNLQSDGIQIYPNPATAQLNIIAGADKINTIIITDLAGRVVYSSLYHDEEVQIDIDFLAPGMYLVRVNNSETRKFVKL